MKNQANKTRATKGFITTSISMPPDMFELSKKRAETLRRNHSNYILTLIADDVAKGKAAK